MQNRLLVCLFVPGLSPYSRIFHSYGDVTITGKGMQILTYARPALMAIEQWGLQRATPTGTRCIVYNGYLCGPVTLIPIAERLGVALSLPVFYDLRLSRLGFEHPTFRLWGQRSNPLRHHRGSFVRIDQQMKPLQGFTFGWHCKWSTPRIRWWVTSELLISYMLCAEWLN